MHITTVTIFELGIVLSVVGVIVTIMLALSGVNHESYFITDHGFLVFLATYMILSLNLIRIIVGISIYTHAGNLIIMSMGHYSDHVTEPLIRGSNTNYVDPLLQALVLTAIVIGFGMTAFLLVLVYRTYRVTKESEIDVLREDEDDEQ